MDKGAVLSWPDKRDLLTLMKIKVEVGTAAFDAEYQNDPLSGDAATFTDFTYWNVLAKQLPAFGAVDPLAWQIRPPPRPVRNSGRLL